MPFTIVEGEYSTGSLTIEPAVVQTGDRLPNYSSDNKQLRLKANSLNEFIGFIFSLIPQVEYVYTTLSDNIFYVWVVFDQFDQQVKDEIYKREREIISEFVNYEFDFYLVARTGRDVKDLISGTVDLAYQKEV